MKNKKSLLGLFGLLIVLDMHSVLTRNNALSGPARGAAKETAASAAERSKKAQIQANVAQVRKMFPLSKEAAAARAAKEASAQKGFSSSKVSQKEGKVPPPVPPRQGASARIPAAPGPAPVFNGVSFKSDSGNQSLPTTSKAPSTQKVELPQQNSGRPAFLSQIESGGFNLKKTTSVERPSDSRQALLQSIQKGAQLKTVDQQGVLSGFQNRRTPITIERGPAYVAEGHGTKIEKPQQSVIKEVKKNETSLFSQFNPNYKPGEIPVAPPLPGIVNKNNESVVKVVEQPKVDKNSQSSLQSSLINELNQKVTLKPVVKNPVDDTKALGGNRQAQLVLANTKAQSQALTRLKERLEEGNLTPAQRDKMIAEHNNSVSEKYKFADEAW